MFASPSGSMSARTPSRSSFATAAAATSPPNSTLGSHVSSHDVNYYSLHHLTALPASITKFADRTFSQGRIERALHSRMEQFTNRDSDRFRQLLRWIKNKQTLRNPEGTNSANGNGDDLITQQPGGISMIRRRDFQNVLEVLGVFATQEQANNLFDKYDVKGRGFLTLHELMCRASSALERDYDHTGTVPISELASGRNDGPRSDDLFAAKGKKQYLRLKLTGEGERPITPQQNSNLITIPIIVSALREKLRINTPVGVTASLPAARRHLARVFEYYDSMRLGVIGSEQLVRALHSINFPLTAQHTKLLMDAFPSPIAPPCYKETKSSTLAQAASLSGTLGNTTTGQTSIYAIRMDPVTNQPIQDPSVRGFDYVGFIMYVYPEQSNGSIATAVSGLSASDHTGMSSLHLNHGLGQAFFDQMSVEERRKRGLPPTHEQYEEMVRQSKEAEMKEAIETAGGEYQPSQQGEYDYDEKEPSHPQLQPQPSPRSRHQSQFARERAPPTPPAPLTPSEAYRTIVGRSPPETWKQTLEKNQYLQTVIPKEYQQTPTRNHPTSNGHNNAATANSQSIQFHSPLPLPVLPSTPRTMNSNAYANGSQSARTHHDRSNVSSFLPSPLSPRHTRLMTPGSSTRSYPSAAGSEFVPNSSFLKPSSLTSSISAAAAAVTNGSLPSPRTPMRPSLVTSPSAHYSSSQDPFADILASPTPSRRPTTGITTYVRGGTNRPLPPVRK